jgi:hypothetical protein
MEVDRGQRPVKFSAHSRFQAADAEIFVLVIDRSQGRVRHPDSRDILPAHRHISPPQIAQDSGRISVIPPALALVLGCIERRREVPGVSGRRQPDRHVADDDDTFSSRVMGQVGSGEAGRGQHVVVEKENDVAD